MVEERLCQLVLGLVLPECALVDAQPSYGTLSRDVWVEEGYPGGSIGAGSDAVEICENMVEREPDDEDAGRCPDRL